MDFYLKKFRRHSLCFVPLIFLLVWFCPLIFWFRLTEYSDRTASEFLGYLGTRGVLIYGAAALTAAAADFAFKYRNFMRQLSEFTHDPAALLEIKFPGHRLYLTGEGLISTYGMAVRYADIDRLIIERSETESLAVYHMYIYRREGKRLIIPVGFRTLPRSFDETLSEYNIEVIRQNRPLLGRGGKIIEK